MSLFNRFGSIQLHDATRTCVRTTARVATALLFVAGTAQAQWRAGAFLGAEHESSWDEFLVLGVDARGLLAGPNIEVNPRFSYFIREGTTRFQLDANVIKPLVLAHKSRIEPYVGLGLALEKVSYESTGDPDDDIPSETSFGFNYIAGGTLKTNSRLQPFAQFQYTVLHESLNSAVISVGLHFKFGGTPAPAPTPAAKPAPPVTRPPVRR